MSYSHDKDDAQAQAKLEIFSNYKEGDVSDLQALTALRSRSRMKDIWRREERRKAYETKYAELVTLDQDPSIVNPEKQILGVLAASQKASDSVLPVLQRAKETHQRTFGKMMAKTEGGDFIMEAISRVAPEDPSVKQCLDAFQAELQNPTNATDSERKAYSRMRQEIRMSKVFAEDENNHDSGETQPSKKNRKAKALTALFVFLAVLCLYSPSVLALARNV